MAGEVPAHEAVVTRGAAILEAEGAEEEAVEEVEVRTFPNSQSARLKSKKLLMILRLISVLW